MGVVLIVTVAVLLPAYSIEGFTAPHNIPIKETNNSNKSHYYGNTNTNITLLTYREPDIGINIKYPSNWVKREAGLVNHTIAAIILMQTDVRDRTNVTLAELDLRIYAQNATATDILSALKRLKTHQNEAVLNLYENPAAKTGFLVQRDLNRKSGLEELQFWSVVPSKHVLAEMLYLANPLDYFRYLPIAKQIMQSLKVSS